MMDLLLRENGLFTICSDSGFASLGHLIVAIARELVRFPGKLKLDLGRRASSRHESDSEPQSS